MVDLTAPLASRLAALALGHVTREYPNKPDHVLRGDGDLQGPRALHPLFYGSFDWHSCVHGYWLLCTLLRTFPALPEAARIGALLDAQITPETVAGELAYAEQPGRETFERPYGWAWLLMLRAELARHADDAGRRRAETLAPLARAFARRFLRYLPYATYPVRTGTHANSAFALALALEYATLCRDDRLFGLARDKARAWFENDGDCQAWEPGGEDFLSPALIEAECMRRALRPPEYGAWLRRFLPRLEQREPAALFAPVIVSDRTDARIAHLDGLNLSRAWCFRSIARALDADDARRAPMLAAADAHVRASLPHLATDYAGEHWLATFAVLALGAGG
ncbi:MAG: hypothetical protein JWM87_4081 [Candidatus Eremiobacteraeota bacterium]|nr:hypothetical protein [Candidatus Eremiobacteraeota bacterium]